MVSASTITNLYQLKEEKAKYPDSIIIFRVRDRYEVYDQDALDCCEILGIAVSGVKNDIPIAGFPHHDLDSKLSRIVRAGRKVAIIEPKDNHLNSGMDQLNLFE